LLGTLSAGMTTGRLFVNNWIQIDVRVLIDPTLSTLTLIVIV